MRILVRDQSLVEDLVQETFLRAYRARDRYDPDRDLWPWLATIARRVCTNARESAHRRREIASPELPEVVGSGGDPQDVYDAAERARLVRAGLTLVPPRFRRVLELRYEQDMSMQEIAEAEGLSIQAVKSLLFRARAALRAVVDPSVLD